MNEKEKAYNGNEPAEFVSDTQNCDSVSQKILAAFRKNGVTCELKNVVTGPTVTLYEISVGDHITLPRISKSVKRIELELQCPDLRSVISPISGAVILEIPNGGKQKDVPLMPLLKCEYARHVSSGIAFALGIDAENDEMFPDLRTLPHLMVGGRSGSGKTTLLNSIIISIAERSSPDDVKFVLINTKTHEFGAFGKLSHLLMPPVESKESAIEVLESLYEETNRRFDLLSKAGIRDFDLYNYGALDRGESGKLPYIVVIIDDIDELFSAGRSKAEMLCAGIMQRSRAVGMHFVITTGFSGRQTIPGIIKACVPSRICLKVDTPVQSRTILDAGGAEKLLGDGDMLFAHYASNTPTRVKGAIAEGDIGAIVDSIAEKWKAGAPVKTPKEKFYENPFASDVLRLLIENRKLTVGMIQRKLTLGYNRASDLMDGLVDLGCVSFNKECGHHIALLENVEYEKMISEIIAEKHTADGEQKGRRYERDRKR